MKIMISAGEVSGDVHGSYLVRELKKLKPDIYFFGMGSEKLAAAGMDLRLDITKRGSIGIFEALPNIIPIYFAYRKLVRLLKKERPQLLILIDSQGINMPLAKAAKKLGIKTVYYIAPQEWLWGTPKGARKVAETIDLIVAIFEKEFKAYRQAGANVVYFGHPLLDIVKPSLAREEVRQQFFRDSGGPVIALCPGSRAQEIKALLPVLLKAGELIQKEIPEARFIISAVYTDMMKKFFEYVGDFHPLAVVGHTYDILAASDLALCTSGTINLEASILGTPNIMIYKLSQLTYLVGKHVLKILDKLPYFSMPNLLLDAKVIPELTMEEAAPEKITAEAISILKDSSRRQKMQQAFNNLKTKLGSPGVLAKIAENILSFASA